MNLKKFSTIKDSLDDYQRCSTMFPDNIYMVLAGKLASKLTSAKRNKGLTIPFTLFDNKFEFSTTDRGLILRVNGKRFDTKNPGYTGLSDILKSVVEAELLQQTLKLNRPAGRTARMDRSDFNKKIGGSKKRSERTGNDNDLATKGTIFPRLYKDIKMPGLTANFTNTYVLNTVGYENIPEEGQENFEKVQCGYGDLYIKKGVKFFDLTGVTAKNGTSEKALTGQSFLDLFKESAWMEWVARTPELAAVFEKECRYVICIDKTVFQGDLTNREFTIKKIYA